MTDYRRGKNYNKHAILYDHFKGETSIHGLWSIAAARGILK